ncbi:MAG: extracellular solute-binding protein [Lachnospiraceae bacterium]
MKRRVLATLLATTMLTTLLAGCGSTEETASEETTSEVVESEVETEVEAVAVEEEWEVKTVSMLFLDSATSPYSEDWPMLDWIEEECGVRLELTAVPSADYTAKFQLVLNSGSLPDIMISPGLSTTDTQSGMLLPISEYVDDMPNLVSFLEEYNLTDIFDAQKDATGYYYQIPTKVHDDYVQNRQWLVRTDVFEENNVPIPTTLDELYDAGVALKEIYPEAKIISNRFGANNILGGISSGFDTIVGSNGLQYDWDTGEWIFAPDTDNYKDMLEYVNNLVSDGVLDVEFTTMDSVTFESDLIQGSLFMLYDYASNVGRYNVTGQEVDPDFLVEMIYVLEGYDGAYATSRANPWDRYMCFSAELEDDPEQLEAVLRFLDWGYTEEARDIMVYGIEGESYTIDENGTYSYILEDLDAELTYGVNASFVIRQHKDLLTGTLTDKELAIMDEMIADDCFPTANPVSPLDADESEMVAVVNTVITDYLASMNEAFIFGEESFDNWDTFISECYSKGAQQLLDAYNG